MKKTLFVLAIMLATAGRGVAQQPEAPGAMGFAPAAEQRDDEQYREATSLINQAKWQAALEKLTQIAKAGGSKADGAMYWQAYAQNKLGQRAEALATIAALAKRYPNSAWVKDARALEIELRAASGQAVSPQAQSDDDLKMYAVNSLMGMDPDQAFPILQKILTGNQSATLKEKALFVLAQSDSKQAQTLIGQIARGQANPELQLKAIRQLGIRGDRETLGSLYTSGSAPVKKEVLRSLGICGGKQQLLNVARTETDPALKAEAIRGLAIAGGREELRQLYSTSADAQTKRELIRSAVISGDQQALLNVIQTEPDAEVKREAIRTLGITGGRDVSQTLINIYNTDKERRTREAVAQALFVHGDGHALVELAKKETDPEMRKMLVQRMSVMGNNKEVQEYLMQLLEK